MAEMIHSVLRGAHISLGFVGLAMFWVPALAPKGGRVHVVAGKVFAVCAYAVGFTALGSSAWVLIHPSSWSGQAIVLTEVPIDQIMFLSILGLLALFLLNGVESGVRMARTRQQPEDFAGLRLRVLNWMQAGASTGVLLFGVYHLAGGGGPMFAIPTALGVAGLLGFLETRQFLANPRPTPMAWWYRHMDGMVGSGIAFHTAFLVFGARNIFGGALIEGTWSFIPWILPAAIGIPAVRIWIRYYKKKFGELPEAVADAPAVGG